MAEVRERFSAQIDSLMDNAGRVLNSLQNGFRKWHTPDLNGWSGDPLDIVGLPQAFDRDENASDYREAVTRDGTVGDLTASQLQGDYLAIQQRAFAVRHATLCRSAVHAASRRHGQSANGGVFAHGVRSYIENLVRAGKES